MTVAIEGIEENFTTSIAEFENSTALDFEQNRSKLISQADRLLSVAGGIDALYNQINRLTNSGLFKGTSWEDVKKLHPSLSPATLKSGYPNNVYEMLSSIRVLGIANGIIEVDDVERREADDFLEAVVVQNLDLIFDHLSESDRLKMTKTELKKLSAYFDFMMGHISFDRIKESLREELDHLIAQRPIDTHKIVELIELVNEQLNLKEGEDIQLIDIVKALHSPTPKSGQEPEAYRVLLPKLTEEQLLVEATALGERLAVYGLASAYHCVFVQHFFQQRPDLVKRSLGLTKSGKAEWDKHSDFIKNLISRTLELSTAQSLAGIREVLERNLLSRNAVYNGIKALMSIKVNPEIERKLSGSHWSDDQTPALKTLIAGTLAILGQPLGIGQGLNPTCQSARGISLWSEHAPAKLINMIITVAEYDNMEFRFEGQLIESQKTAEGLAKNFDFALDPVSIVLVPHLDRIYSEMMKRASGRIDDPHKWVNPAMYGQWIPTGFASAYNYMTATIHQYQLFLRKFIAAFHRNFNGNRKLIYPVPLGIFITSTNGDMLGFHAISMLRVSKAEKPEDARVYFLNPNNEGRQNWGQGIKPTVSGNGERPGESSLPFAELASRVYAYHYNQMGLDERLSEVDEELLEKINDLARSSWGKSYNWTN